MASTGSEKALVFVDFCLKRGIDFNIFLSLKGVSLIGYLNRTLKQLIKIKTPHYKKDILLFFGVINAK